MRTSPRRLRKYIADAATGISSAAAIRCRAKARTQDLSKTLPPDCRQQAVQGFGLDKGMKSLDPGSWLLI